MVDWVQFAGSLPVQAGKGEGDFTTMTTNGVSIEAESIALKIIQARTNDRARTRGPMMLTIRAYWCGFTA